MAGRFRKSHLTTWNSVFERLYSSSCQTFTVPRGKESSMLHLQYPEAVGILGYAHSSTHRVTQTQIKQDTLHVSSGIQTKYPNLKFIGLCIILIDE